jgi:predicted Zn-dependent protease
MEQKPDVNAFALPGGTVVLLDGLVRRTDADDRLLAIVAHELGHAARRHSTQALVKAVGIGAVATLLWGDFSGQVAGVPAVLAMLDYSRDAEREADDDAVRLLRATGRSARPMFEALCLLASVERETGMDGVPSVLSSHPDIEERIARVRELGGLARVTCSRRAPLAPPPGRAGPSSAPPAPRARWSSAPR